MQSQHRKFTDSWFLFWRSQEARRGLANVYRRLELLNAEVDVGSLAEEQLSFLTNYRACGMKLSSRSGRLRPDIALVLRLTPLSQCSLRITCKRHMGLVNQQMGRKGCPQTGSGRPRIKQPSEACRSNEDVAEV